MTPGRPTHPTSHRLVLRVLDHQVVGPDGELLGNVDDLGLVVDGATWSVTGLQVGPAALGQRLPGKLGEWTIAIWRRLTAEPHPQGAFVPFADVTDIGSAVTVGPSAAALLVESFGLERWLARYVVSRIPGAKGGGDQRPGGGGSQRQGAASDRGGPGGRRRAGDGPPRVSVSDVVGCVVLGDDGAELGVVHDLVCVEPPGRRRRDHLVVTHLVYGPHRAGSQLGYDADRRQGPLLVGALVRWWQRAHRVAPLEQVASLDLEVGTVQVLSAGEHVHPHDLPEPAGR